MKTWEKTAIGLASLCAVFAGFAFPAVYASDTGVAPVTAVTIEVSGLDSRAMPTPSGVSVLTPEATTSAKPTDRLEPAGPPQFKSEAALAFMRDSNVKMTPDISLAPSAGWVTFITIGLVILILGPAIGYAASVIRNRN